MSATNEPNAPANKAAEVVYNFINALNGEDFETVRNCLSEDMVFGGVLGHRDGAAAYVEDMKKMQFKYKIEKTFADGNDVCLLYNIDMSGKPFLPADGTACKTVK